MYAVARRQPPPAYILGAFVGFGSSEPVRKPADRLRRAQAATGGVVGSPGYNTGIRANPRLAERRLDPGSLDQRSANRLLTC
ncbi:hypothetical protein Raf01_18040 [Rugosimonospora africana]|uniref:Uncharacterized protein n=1 Tax=Rugosimonospora africana TaxID=556532 RepID=A0A8J3VP63_9ACTN|nr:hypothetical protein Raf01_18040 [Rugosimonospora africana]